MRALLLAVIVLASGCASLPRATQSGRLLDVWSKISDKSYIRTRGIGGVPAGTTGQTARRGASRNAGLVAARYELLSVIKGVKLSGGITIAQLMEKDSVVRELADDLVRGGEEVQTEWLNDDGCVITLELRRATVERLIQEKSDRERGLEARIAKDIKEIEGLKRLVALQGFNAADPDMIEALLVKKNAMANAQTWMERIWDDHGALPGEHSLQSEMGGAIKAAEDANAIDLSALRDAFRKSREYQSSPQFKKDLQDASDLVLSSHGGGDEWQARMNQKRVDSPASKEDVRFMSASELSYYLGTR